jgi:hypothetical protein
MTATVTRLAPRQGRCLDCLWVCSIHRDQCDHESVAALGRGLVVDATLARSSAGPCGLAARHLAPRNIQHREAV